MDDGTIKINQDDIQSVFQRLRGTIQYWRVARNELLAKIKQLGLSSSSLHSSAEMRWPEVSVSILKSKGHTIFCQSTSAAPAAYHEVFIEDEPLDQFLASEPIEKATVLSELAVHVTRIFNKRVQSFFKKIVMSHHEGYLTVSFLPVVLKCS